MRIISGSYRGRRLARVPEQIRPTGGRIKESLFDLLGETLQGKVWIEPFAGSGAMAVEALSRGAAGAILNDRDPEALELVRRNLGICGVKEPCELSQADVFVFLRGLTLASVDFVFLDPPHDFGRHRKLLEKVAALEGVGRGTVIILEAFRKLEMDFLPEGLSIFRTLKVGASQIVLMRKVSPDNS